jgi:methyltransferase (TIGR00027 family)
MDPDEVTRLADVVHAPDDFSASVASGSFETIGMVVIPCSMGTLGAIAAGTTPNLVARVADGVAQYVLLGAGVDTFALRRPDLAGRVRVFEIDQPGPQAWKRERLDALGVEVRVDLQFVPVDFEAGASWWDALTGAGFDGAQRAIVASTGVSMYLTEAATVATLRQVAQLPSRSTLAMTFLLPTELVDDADRPGYRAAQDGARRSGTPFVSFYTPEQMVALASDAGFRHVEHVSARDLGARYFADRPDGLRPSTGEDFVVATT